MKAFLLLVALVLIGWVSVTLYGTKTAGSSASRDSTAPAGYRDPLSLKKYVDRLTADGRNWRQHGVYVETLEGSEPVAMLNDEAEFNPASVIKLATTLAALDKLGRNYRFRTEFRTEGEIDRQSGDLNGNIILLSGGDPSFSAADAQKAGAALQNLGIRRVNGSLLVVGEFTCEENSSTKASAGIFQTQTKLQFLKPPIFEGYDKYTPRGRLLLTIESAPLLEIVRYLNAHSVNAMADMLGLHIGGPAGVQKFLINSIGMPGDAVYISHASGLEVNRMTPKNTVNMLRAMMHWLSDNDLDPPAVMAVAGIDSGTLRGRFGGQFAGSVVAKTGTLYGTDSGVAALAGIMYTRARGPLLFAVYDMAEGKRVPQLRNIQDDFLRQVIVECGGPVPRARRKGENSEPRSTLIPAPQRFTGE
ncbi:MAG: D-alanyl-D-alanine carboxypeptidase [Blastocatellia bacterium]|nr:D-alanyl-D-alanine carboxypeptidase [Blastocatellia bacterium]